MKLILALCVLFVQGSLGDLVVQLPNGRVQGTSFNTTSGRQFFGWRGIPYGKPPVGHLRFLAPVRAEPWTGTRDATIDAPACEFFGTFPSDPTPLIGNSEDCLYINVYSPVPVDFNTPVRPTRPVLFWIYGGGFFTGFSDFGFYDPSPFLEDDVIIVTFNYRLGTLGFLSTEDEVILGNAGLKDQVLALNWVRENIAFFGGSPDDVTIFGESAGGISVGYHVISPLSRNLFKGAIMQSGTALMSLVQSDARQTALTLASRIDPSITSRSTSTEIRDVLQAAPLAAIKQLGSGQLSPVIEIHSPESFISESLYETLEAGNFARVPVIIGYNSEETIGTGNDTSMYVQIARLFDSNKQFLAPNIKLREYVNTTELGAKVHEQYAGRNGLFAQNLAAYFQFSSDSSFGRSSTKHALLQSRFSSVYMYIFSYYGTLSKDNLIIPGAGKVAHAQEVGYLFNISNHRIETDKDFLARRRFVKLWTNFAKTSNPTPYDESAELLQHVKWEPIYGTDIKYLDIDDDLEIKPYPKLDKAAFWDYVWSTYSYRPYNTF